MVELQPKICNLCGSKVIYTSNSVVYGGREYGSGFCYLCTQCGAYVGIHKPRPNEALGLLADAKMRSLKMQCHELFDRKWRNHPQNTRRLARKRAYEELAEKLDIDVSECHFGYFNLDMLNRALDILQCERN